MRKSISNTLITFSAFAVALYIIAYFAIIYMIIHILYYYYIKLRIEPFENLRSVDGTFENVKKPNYDDYFILCSKYDKPTNFLDEFEIPIKYSVLQKKIDVPNVANEATTYLHYIIQNYDNLPNNVIFIHDENASWHHDGKITENIYKWIDDYENNGRKYFNFNNGKIGSFDTLEKPVYNVLRLFWDDVFKEHVGEFDDKINPNNMGMCCAQFIVSKEDILKRPISFYTNYYDWLITNTNGEGNGNPADLNSGYNTGRYAEYTWQYIFS